MRFRGEKRKIQGPQNVRYQRRKGTDDWTPSGYNYMGPGNAMDGAPAQNFADEFAHEHDTLYGEYQQQTGRNAKYEYVIGADDVFEQKMSNTRSNMYEEMGFQTFRAKRKLAEFGIIPTGRLNKMSKRKEFSFINMEQGTHFSKCLLTLASEAAGLPKIHMCLKQNNDGLLLLLQILVLFLQVQCLVYVVLKKMQIL